MFAVQSLSKTIVLLFLFLGVANVSTKRVQRTLIYPPPKSKIQMIYGVGLPVALEDVSITMGYVVKANYFLPKNVSDYTEPEIILQRKRRNNDARWNLYKLLSHFLQRFGGKSCILRSICEFVHMPLDTNFGVIEEILHLIFRPSATNEYFIDPMDKEYVAAENIGRIARNGCQSIYRDCTFNMIDLFTKLM